MAIGLARISVQEFTERIFHRSGMGNWFLLVAPGEDALELAEQIAYSLARESGTEECAAVDRPANADEVVDLAGRKETLVLAGIDTWPPSEWARWDVLRSRLLPSHKVAFVISRLAAASLFSKSQHFVRLFSGSIWEVKGENEGLDAEVRERLLRALEDWGEMSTAEMVQKAERKELAADPEFADWLILAGRSDLL